METERPLPFRENTNGPNFRYPKFIFRASVVPTSKELIKEANSILYRFIWHGKDKVKCLAPVSDIEMGGLMMLDIDSMISAK